MILLDQGKLDVVLGSPPAPLTLSNNIKLALKCLLPVSYKFARVHNVKMVMRSCVRLCITSILHYMSQNKT